MKKRNLAAMMAAVMVVGSSMTSFAGTWEPSGTDWKYIQDDGSYITNGWQWIDGKSYYFDSNGIMLADTTTPDGYQVNGDGAWVVNGVVQTQDETTQTTNGVNHNAGYDSAHPLAGKIDEWNLRLPRTTLTGFDITNNNVQAMLTGQMDQYYAPPVGQSVNPETGTTMYVFQEDYDYNRKYEQDIYRWFCNWLNGMDFENMSEMERAREIQKVLASCSYDTAYANNFNDKSNSELRGDYAVLINKTGICTEFAMAACSMSRALGLKCAVKGNGNHSWYYIQVDGQVYVGENQVLTLDFPSNDYVYFP